MRLSLVVPVSLAPAYLPICIVGNFVAQAVKGEDIVINGSGKPIRSFMYLGDMVFWVMTILLKGKAVRITT